MCLCLPIFSSECATIVSYLRCNTYICSISIVEIQLHETCVLTFYYPNCVDFLICDVIAGYFLWLIMQLLLLANFVVSLQSLQNNIVMNLIRACPHVNI